MGQLQAGKAVCFLSYVLGSPLFATDIDLPQGYFLADPPESTTQIPGPSQDSNHSPVILAMVSITNGPEIKNLTTQMAGKAAAKTAYVW